MSYDNEGVSVSKFDYSVENHFKAMDKIGLLDDDGDESLFDYDKTEIQRFSSSATFLRKWRDFCYQPRDIRFDCESKTPQENDVTGRINLPQFSSAAVPKEFSDGNESSSPLSKDFVMYVGGHVWALDWCPRVHQSSNYDCNVEFIAVSAHPPESSYHIIGAPLSGRGLIQIWCMLNTGVKDQDVTSLVKLKSRTRTYTRNKEAKKPNDDQPKRPRGRPRKTPLSEISVQSSENSNKLPQLVGKADTNKPKKPMGTPRKNPIKPSVNNFDKSPGPSPQPLAFEFPDQSPNLFDAYKNDPFIPETVTKEDGVSNKLHEHVTKNKDIVYKRRPKSYKKEETLKSMLTSIKSTLRKCKGRKKSLVNADNLPLQNNDSISEDVQNNLVLEPVQNNDSISEEIQNNLVFELVQTNDSEEETLKSMLTSIKSNLRKCKGRKKSLVNADNLPIQNNVSISEDVQNNLVLEPVQNNDSISEEMQNNLVFEPVQTNDSISEDVALPRLVIGLAHNGKVAWDVKWKPVDSNNISKHRMGYLAVLLGSGALEVWEIPLPRATKAIFSSCKTEGSDPRFVKLKPVFMCSMLKCGDVKSIPITLEWSTAAPHDLILAGCHDGTVALWKFFSNGPSKDTRPLIRFSADTVPIRALKWAPLASDPESANIIVTSGHKGLKFWDLRDPFRPLWDIPTQKIVYSLDWLPDPSCLISSFDDGEIRIMSLSRAASDVPITGMPCEKTLQSGSHSYRCSASSIWSIHMSITGMVAYCCSDGKVIHFQLTTRALGKDHHRNREPHYLCGSLDVEGSTLTVFSPLPNVTFTLKRSLSEWGNTPRSKRGFLSHYNQEKRAKKAKTEIPKCQVTGNSSDSEDEMVTTQKKKTSQKTKTGTELVCIDDGDKNREDNVIEEEKESLPPKIIAMHRVRWNMNKGSESLLCYGGASGIVRCQQIR